MKECIIKTPNTVPDMEQMLAMLLMEMLNDCYVLVGLVSLYTTPSPQEWFTEIFREGGEYKSLYCLYCLKTVIINSKISVFS